MIHLTQKFEHLLRKTLDEANAMLTINPIKHGISAITRVRAVQVDGNQMMVTMDMRTDRLNVIIENDIIIGFSNVG